MASQAPASDPAGKTAASPAPAPPVSGGGDGRVGGRLRVLVEALGDVAALFAASTPGRAIFAVVGLKTLIAVFGGAATGWLRAIDTVGTVALVAALGYLLARMLTLLLQRFLWRVRRKLVLSYVLIGFVADPGVRRVLPGVGRPAPLDGQLLARAAQLRGRGGGREGARGQDFHRSARACRFRGLGRGAGASPAGVRGAVSRRIHRRVVGKGDRPRRRRRAVAA